MICEKCVYSKSTKQEIAIFLKGLGMQIYDNMNIMCFSAKLDNEIVACAILNINKRAIELDLIYVVPMLRFLAIGTNLFKYLKSYIFDNYPKTNLVIKFNSKYDKNGVDSFYRKNGCTKSIYDYTKYIIPFSCSSNILKIKHKYFNNDNIIYSKHITELALQDKLNVYNSICKYHIPNFLQPFKKVINMIRSYEYFYFNYKDEVLGWCLCYLDVINNININITYIIPTFRKYQLGFYFWNDIYKKVISNGDYIKNIVFEFDKRNMKLYKYYYRLLHDYINQELDYFIINVSGY